METYRSPISEYVDRWRHGEAPSAQAVLRDHPELAIQKSFVLDLAYEEFCLRTEAGEDLAPSTFCNQFPTYRKSLERLLGVHELLAADRGFAALAGDIRWPSPGDDFLGFQLRQELGKGALGRVFLASEPALGDRLVVLKLAPQGGREAEILGKLSHRHIVPVHSVQEDMESGLTAVCMPFLGTATLCDVIDRALAGPGSAVAQVILDAARDDGGRATPRTAPSAHDPLNSSSSYINAVLRIGIQLAGALEFTHSRGVLHRDLKPSNVLITSAGVPMLLDFNLSTDQETREMRVGGTLPYAAPEQLRAILAERHQETDNVDARADLFSLGIVLYELLTGVLPFEPPPFEAAAMARPSAGSPVEASARAILARQAEGPIALRTRSPSVDPAAAAVVDRCLRFDPCQRPQSAAELVGLLERSLAPRRRVIRWSRSHRALSAGASVVVSGLLLAAIVFIAARDPSYIRQYRAGVESFVARNFDDAIERLTLALKEQPDDITIRFARGQAFQQKGDYLNAARDYDAAAKGSSAGMIRACGAYCWAREHMFGDAIAWSRTAIDAGYRTAEVYNNLGYCQIQQGEAAEARKSLTRAIDLNPSLQVPYYNRGLTYVMRLKTDRIPLATGLEDFERAIDIGPPSAQLYFDAACLNAAAPSTNRREIAVRHLVAAFQEGISPAKVKAEPLLAACLGAPEIQRLLEGPAQPRRHPGPVLLIPLPAPSPGTAL